MPSKRIIILDQEQAQRPTFTAVFWADVPTARRAFVAAEQNSYATAFLNATANEKSDIRSGFTREVVERITMPENASLPVIRAALEDRWNALQADVNSFNPWTRYGTFFTNSGTWVNSQVT